MESRIRETKDVVIDIEPVVSFKSPLNANTVEIHIKREKEEYFEYELDGRLSKIGSSKSTPFPTPVILLKDLVSFEPHYMSGLLYSTIEDDLLLSRLTGVMSDTAYGANGPLYMFICIELTPQTFYGGEEEEKETCAICLEEITHSKTGPHSSAMPYCSHEFHDDCIYSWLTNNTTCPLCRTLIEYEP